MIYVMLVSQELLMRAYQLFIAASVVVVSMLVGSFGAYTKTVDAVVGEVEAVSVFGYGTPPESPKVPKYEKDSVVHDEVIETADDGAMSIRLVDDTRLVLGSRLIQIQ